MNLSELPAGRYFISHSYDDAAARERLLAALPPHVEPLVFPAITVSPKEFVSTPLMRAILGCGGLISLTSGHSEESFWVTFERDFAKHNNVACYAWDVRDETLIIDPTPIDSEIIAFSDPSNWSEVDQVIERIRERSYPVVPVWKDPQNRWVPREGSDLRLTSATRVPDPSFLIFVGGDTSRDFLNELVLLGRRGMLYSHRVLVAYLTTGHAFPRPGTAFADVDGRQLEADFLGELMLRWGPIVDDLESHVVYLRDGQDGPLIGNYIDDLIVRISWNMYRERGPVR